MTIPIQGIMDLVVSMAYISFAFILSSFWIYLFIIPIITLIHYFIFVSRIDDCCIGFVVYQSRWEQWHGITRQARLIRRQS